MRILQRSVDLGIRLFDTADLYDRGGNEERIGRFLKDRRNQVEVATKVGNSWRADGSGWDWNPRKEYIIEAVELSLRRLRTDRIDLYQLHGGTMEDPIDEAIDAFETLKQQGKILRYGISSIRPNVVREYLAKSGIETVMCQYGVTDRRPEEAILPMIRAKGVRLLARGALARGMLCGKAPKDFQGHSADEMRKAAEAVSACSSPIRTPAQTAVRFVLQSHSNTTVVVGVSRLEQLEELAATIDTPALSQTEWDHIASALPPRKYTEHR
jgi:aryl-alcohol dehydrogenase-like predicted oxidoreductase